MIKFGTSGWRAIIGEDFTFRNVRLVTKAVVELIRRYGRGDNGMLVGYDTRFLSEKFAQETAKIISSGGIKTLITDRDAPTPAISFAIIKHGFEGGINFTASNNPAEYNGLKFLSSTGCTALPELTNPLEEEIEALDASGIQFPPPPITIELNRINVHDDYLKAVSSKIDMKAISGSSLAIGLDLLYGTARDYLDEILLSAGCETYTLHNFIDPYFGGYSPSSSEENLGELKALIQEKKLDVGLATSADSDRFGILDEKGNFIHPNVMIPLLLRYLAKEQNYTGSAARSVATSHMVDLVARAGGLDVVETPVGFKYVSSLFLSDKIVFGGEESGGISIKGHIPVKDGILASLLVAEMLAKTETALSKLIEEMYRDLGVKIHFDAVRHLVKREHRPVIEEKIKAVPSTFAGKRIVNINQTDGIKLYTEDDSWVLVRFSGTEPVLRIYAESVNKKEVKSLIKAAREYYLV